MVSRKSQDGAAGRDAGDAGEPDAGGVDEQELTEEEKKQKALEAYRKAGDIARRALQRARDATKVGKRLADLVEETEKYIIEQGGGIGFPMNVSINNVAAHYTAGPRDLTEFEEGMVIKLDIGVHVDGYIADHATTVNLSDDPALADIYTAAEKSMEKGIDMLKVGARTGDIGKAIYEVIKSYKFTPVRDLSGHSLERWIVHGGKQVPLVPVPGGGDTIEAGDVIAVETFASTGEGHTHPQNVGYIYQLMANRIPKVRNKAAKKLVSYIAKNYKTLPFCHRSWAGEVAVPRFALNELINSGILMQYRVLSDIKGSFVAQAEKTVYIHEDHVEILT